MIDGSFCARSIKTHFLHSWDIPWRIFTHVFHFSAVSISAPRQPEMKGGPMLNINPETICFIIDKARQFHAKEEVSIPEVPTSPADDWARQVLADHEDDLCFYEVRSTIYDLEPDQMKELVALMWLGRGDYELSEWDMALQDALEVLNLHITEYMLAHPMLAEHLVEGLILHGYSCEG
jgi:hypothetical protein